MRILAPDLFTLVTQELGGGESGQSSSRQSDADGSGLKSGIANGGVRGDVVRPPPRDGRARTETNFTAVKVTVTALTGPIQAPALPPLPPPRSSADVPATPKTVRADVNARAVAPLPPAIPKSIRAPAIGQSFEAARLPVVARSVVRQNSTPARVIMAGTARLDRSEYAITFLKPLLSVLAASARQIYHVHRFVRKAA